MILFFDTSALVKLFHEEKGSDVVTHLIKQRDNEIWVSELEAIEESSLKAMDRHFQGGLDLKEDELALGCNIQ